MSIVKLALKRPYTFVVLAILIFIFGGLAIVRTPTDIFPNIDILVVSIIWNYNGRSLFTALVLEDSGGDPWIGFLNGTNQGQPLDLTRFLRIAVGLVAARGQVHRRGLIPRIRSITVVLRPAFVIVGGTR